MKDRLFMLFVLFLVAAHLFATPRLMFFLGNDTGALAPVSKLLLRFEADDLAGILNDGDVIESYTNNAISPNEILNPGTASRRPIFTNSLSAINNHSIFAYDATDDDIGSTNSTKNLDLIGSSHYILFQVTGANSGPKTIYRKDRGTARVIELWYDTSTDEFNYFTRSAGVNQDDLTVTQDLESAWNIVECHTDGTNKWMKINAVDIGSTNVFGLTDADDTYVQPVEDLAFKARFNAGLGTPNLGMYITYFREYSGILTDAQKDEIYHNITNTYIPF